MSFLLSVFITIVFSVSVHAKDESGGVDNYLTLSDAVFGAQNNDLWLMMNQYSQDSIDSERLGAGLLPDPTFTFGLSNIAIESLDFSQEPMTQFKVGVSQMFPRGKSLELKQRQLMLKGRQFPYQRQDRKAQIKVVVSQLWLDIYKAQQSIALIENDRALFLQLADIATANYSTALGKTRQQDLVRAQLEMTYLEDRLSLLEQRKDIALKQLSEWLVDEESVNVLMPKTVSVNLPNIKLLDRTFYQEYTASNTPLIFERLSQHPSMMALQQKIQAGRAGIELAKQRSKPEWGVSASYGYRDADSAGNDRADLLSVELRVDMPIFTPHRHDHHVKTALTKTNAVEIEKRLFLRKLKARFDIAWVKLKWLDQRKKLYQLTLLPQVKEQAESSLIAYTNDDGDFSEVVRARIAELNAAIDALTIDVDRQKVIVQLNYFFTDVDVNQENQHGDA